MITSMVLKKPVRFMSMKQSKVPKSFAFRGGKPASILSPTLTSLYGGG